MDDTAMLDRVVPLFAAGGRFHGRYRLSPEPDHRPTELVAGALWEVPVFPTGSQSCELMRVYAFDSSIGSLLHAHWRNEARALLRLSTRGHRALPRLREAELLEAAELGYLILTDSGTPLEANAALLDEFAQDRKRAFLAFFAIVEAVAAMHEEGLLHRNLTSQALRVADERGAIVVDGFHMSSFLSAWFRPHDAISKAALAPFGAARWMLAPERIAALIGEPTRDVETYATDVFSLGMVGVRLLVGLPPVPPSRYSRGAHREWTTSQREELKRARLPVLLERALDMMISFDRANRIPSAVAAHDLLARSYGVILGDLERRSDEGASVFELLYLAESIDCMYRDGRGRSHPSQPDYPEYNELIAQDLVGGVLTWSPDGFEPWERSGNRRVGKQARVVLMGRAYAYFCAYLDARSPKEDRSRIVVKHMLPMDRAGSLRKAPRQRAAPRVVCSHLAPSQRRLTRSPECGDWSVLAATVEHEGSRAYRDPVTATARWLIDAQRADVRRGWYAVQCNEQEGGFLRISQAEQPAKADDADGAFDRLWELVLPRDPLGTVFSASVAEASETDESPTFVLRRRREDREPIAELRFERGLDPRTCLFSVLNRFGSLPVTGWLMLDDRGQHSQLRRQEDALLDVEQRYGHLAAQMRAPTSFRIPGETPDRNDQSAAANDPSQTLLRQIHETWPLFALQGPPGTGKTFVAAELIKRILEEDRFARVLVAAQSHHALDNLLEGVVDRVSNTALLRIASSGTLDKLSDRARAYVLKESLDRLIRAIESDSGPADSRLRPLAKAWRRCTKVAEVELRADLSRRLPRAASLVFSTSGQATYAELGSSRGAGSFDWVLIEEAARGWITEFFIPMVHGARWLLVGDHAQLPAHRYQDYERLLRRDIDELVTAGNAGVAPNKEWLPLLNHFAHLMTAKDGRDTARGVLRVQRRMHSDIADLISSSFYGGTLDTHPDALRLHGFSATPFAGTSLVWLDTSALGADGHEIRDGGLWNLCEINVLKHFFRTRVGEVPRISPEVPPLAVLSPYKAQVRRIGQQLGYGEDVVHTVHSYQGRQAEVVLVSLVRNNTSAPEKALGFMTDPSIGNVMFSRARRLLVIAGSLSHFDRSGEGTFWQNVVRYVRSRPRFLFDVTADGFSFTRGRA